MMLCHDVMIAIGSSTPESNLRKYSCHAILACVISAILRFCIPEYLSPQNWRLENFWNATIVNDQNPVEIWWHHDHHSVRS